MRGKARKLAYQYWHAGFTLVELLVVVSIISLLMAIMLPALTRAQRQAEGVHCLANQRDLTLAWTQYSIDHDDVLCDPNNYLIEMKAYMPDKDILTCRTVEYDGLKTCYGISSVMGNKGRDGVIPYDQMHRVTRPAERMVFTDVEVGSFGGGGPTTPYWPLIREIDPNEDDDIKRPWLWRPWSSAPAGSLQSTTARHNNGANMSFADGHVAWTRWRDSRTVKLIKGMMADLEEGSKDNPDLDRMVSILVPPKSSDK